nr:ATP-binding cassette domain-containing protein [Treponema parvum]
MREGEIVGLYGLMGAGKTEIARAIFGIDKITSGALFIDGKETEINSPKEAIKQGLGFLTEDRLKNGLALSMSVSENMTLPGLKKIIRNGILGLRLERDVVRATVEKLNIKTASIKAKVKNLSGGNQQKVVFGKWIFADSKVLILDEPTQGIDVGAVEEVHKVILDYSKKNNNGILLISSEINEIVQLADRILIVYDGEIIGDMDGAKAVKERIMETAFAGKKVTEVV